MSNFSDSFWTDDLSSGLSKLFAKLSQGIVENEEVIGLAKRRAESEETHGNRLMQIARESYRKDGFHSDDGASLRQAFEGMVKETEQSAACHLKIASNLNSMVLRPFGRWTQEHASRVHTSEKELQGKVKEYGKHHANVKKLRSTYFNKCRLLEDFEEENKLAFPGPDGQSTPTKQLKKTSEDITADINSVLDDEPIELGEVVYSASQLNVLLESLIKAIAMKDVKMPILGTFEHVSSGSALVECIQKVMGIESLGTAEAIGQDMLNNGLIRYLGVGSTFANSSVLNYQWRDKALVAAGIIKTGPNGFASRAAAMPYVGEYVSSYVTQDHPNETPQQRLSREATQANTVYRESVRKVDAQRTDVEATMMEHLQFMERCELDRLKALKAVMMDISAAISNVIPGMKSSMDTMLLFQESINPAGDLKYMIDSYRTGNFAPKVVVYENYYNNVDDQTFGIDLELRARQDRKRVPNIVSAILSYMDENYPLFGSDAERQKIWLKQVPLQLVHQLRTLLNDGKPVDKKVLLDFDPIIVAAAFKLYLLELPDSAISRSLYEPIKSIYSNYTSEDDSEDRITAISNVLQQLKVSNIATLDAITIHFGRLLELTNADPAYRAALAKTLGHCLLRPKTDSNLTHQDKHPYRLFLDLVDFKKEIFSSLKRVSTTRPRSATDEKDRRVRTEERNKAISQAGKRLTTGTTGGITSSPLRLESYTVEATASANPEDGHPGSRISRSSRHSSEDTPFQIPDEPADLTRSTPSSASFPVSDHSHGMEQSVSSIDHGPMKTPSLSRSVASGHRLSRHTRKESLGPNHLAHESSSSTGHRASVDAEALERQVAPSSELPVSSIKGISLEDGALEFD
ncbi:Putative uncharacterized protein [Taphrina deformans PYCC 5710]|uniref:Rho-GTPase-activating protein 8 n=1 Tax=Taphrina deformans (strain PYCC 5710 / ATCC 11124 / CBS 356.35 / IMI 108563 / JCM 9778 / NBRC 8474) TaxID=1097556 RepID=R4XHG5_TAPDE|nr:Putative uncharacterized protein [Taphrina deformans PYCC 5710]|eukprot:CCG82857.1 Putative uncharacterized protein [Taphrina deformans PYCC 5710]